MTSNTEHFHDTPAEIYARLVALYGESKSYSLGSDTRWVEVGAGATTLVFFAPREAA